MALDYIIVGMQLVGISVNVLALCAFWISPGLRATANRFVINLLVANIVACVALTPALWLDGGLKTRYQQFDSNSIETNTEHILPSTDLDIQAELPKSLDDTLIESMEITTAKPLHHQHHHHHNSHHGHGKVERDVEQPEILDTAPFSLNPKTVEESIESVIIQDGQGNIRTFSEKQVIENGDETDIIGEIDIGPVPVVTERELEIKSINTIKQRSSMAHRTHTVFSENSLIFDCTRFFGFDFAAAVGVLSVVLVVGDTWCAVTDPLRYHSRISYLKSWMLIASVWAVSIAITAVSALRSKWCQINLNLENVSVTDDEDYTNASTTATFSGSSQAMFVANIYALVFSCVYFMLIVLAPITVVCIMYYNIFSEARQSGLRMRRNGSSPLLQSALNLHNSSINTVSLNDNQRYPSIFDVSSPDAITMKIDSQQFAVEDGKTCEYNKKAPIGTHHQYRRYLDIPESGNQQQQQQHQTDKSLCKRQRTKSEKSLSGFKPKLSQIHRHFSARQLEKACDVPSFLTKNHNLSRIITGEMRQVHSSPNLQKLSNLDLMHKVPYCVNNRSTTSINQASQPTTNSPRALSYMVSIRHRLSNASSIFKYREESRAARIGIVVVAMLMLSYLPYGLLILLQGRLTFIPNASIFSILFLLIAICSSPFIFAYRNRRVRRGVCRLFGVDTTKTNSYLQKQRMQLRNAQSNKHVRIHRNLSASNFSLNMLPYKLATANSMLPIQNEQMHGTVQSRHGSVLVPIDDVETESNENSQYDLEQKKIDENNNKLNKMEMFEEKVQKGSLLQRICRNSLRKISTSDAVKEQPEPQHQIEIKDDGV
ncbi:uncharacterized protein LOC116339769 [Contarinia nasturtii]|uniref:uncharacterized protein LOC116339769 n=1 Tax=Contarinia nasturtii TaxID=265458 RepID=UPI0012D43DC5|nr:uncharacterized protein LOC116339769 [Contarinia nasturtii]XP_031621668.1 uncharacterized protein LOC116339769 [Contarinia nasturtii]